MSRKIYVLTLWIVAVAVHAAFLIASWDMYLTGAEFPELGNQIESSNEALSKRAVLFLVGGLNATEFLTNIKEMDNSILRNVIIDKGSWGISWSSDTSSETILSILSGTYDAARRFNSFSGNPDDITTKLNQVIYVGATPLGKVKPRCNWHIYSYPERWHKYISTYDDVTMDSWVLKQTKILLNNDSLAQDKTLFIIYFEGLKVINELEDKYSPKATQAFARIISYIEELVRDFSQTSADASTVYFLTSHYFSSEGKDYARHPLGHVAVPILAWGASISGRIFKGNEWPSILNQRKDIDVIDIAPLISCILGVPIPAHSTGGLPFSYLQLNASFAARCALTNVKQLRALFLSEMNHINMNAFLKLSETFAPVEVRSIDMYYQSFKKYLDKGNYNIAINDAETLISRLIEGITYYRYYYSRLAKILISFMQIGWLIFLSSSLLHVQNVVLPANNAGDSPGLEEEEASKKPPAMETSNAGCTAIPSKWKKLLTPSKIFKLLIQLLYVALTASLVVLGVLAKWPVRTTIYLTGLFCIWGAVIKCSYRWLSFRTGVLDKTKPESFLKTFIYFFVLVLNCAFFCNVIVLIGSMFLLILSLPYSDYSKVKNCYLGDWILTSLTIIHFTGYSSISLSTTWTWLTIQTLICLIFAVIFAVQLQTKLNDYPLLVISFISILSATMCNCILDQNSTQSIVWLCPVMWTFSIFIGSNSLIIRMIQNSLCLSVPYFLTAKSYEPIAFLGIVVHLFTWLTVETYKIDGDEQLVLGELPNKPSRRAMGNMMWCDVRRAFMFIIYFVVCYLALGNSHNILELLNNVQSVNMLPTNWKLLAVYLVKLTTANVVVSISYLFITKLSKTDTHTELIIVLFLLAIIGFILLIVAIAANSIGADHTSVSNYIFFQVVILSFLVTYPLSQCLTSSSILTLTTLYRLTQRSEIPPNS